MDVGMIEDIYELSPTQQGMLFHSLYAPETGVYILLSCLTLHGTLNVPAFERAWQRVLDRHSALRTSFHWEEADKPLQVVHRQVKLPLERHDWRGLAPDEQEERRRKVVTGDVGVREQTGGPVAVRMNPQKRQRR